MIVFCQSCYLPITVGVTHKCDGTLGDRVRRKCEIIARVKAKKDGVPVGVDDWKLYERKVLYDMLDPNHNSSQASSDNKFSVTEIPAIDSSI